MIAQSTPEQVLKVVAKWRMYIGIPKNEVGEELAVITDFIHKNYGHMTLQEIELAYNLSAMNRLDNVEFYGSFSPMYVGKVISAYLHYRKVLLTDAIREREKKIQEELEIANRPTPEQQRDFTREILGSFYNEYKEKGDFNDLLSLTFKHLRKYGYLKPSKEEVAEAMKYANHIIDTRDKKPIDRDFEVKLLGRKYVVKKYFDKISFDMLMNNIKTEHFS